MLSPQTGTWLLLIGLCINTVLGKNLLLSYSGYTIGLTTELPHNEYTDLPVKGVGARVWKMAVGARGRHQAAIMDVDVVLASTMIIRIHQGVAQSRDAIPPRLPLDRILVLIWKRLDLRVQKLAAARMVSIGNKDMRRVLQLVYENLKGRSGNYDAAEVSLVPGEPTIRGQAWLMLEQSIYGRAFALLAANIGKRIVRMTIRREQDGLFSFTVALDDQPEGSRWRPLNLDP